MFVSSSLLIIDEYAEFVSSFAVVATLLVEFPEQVLESLPSAAVDLMLQELFDVRGFALKMSKWILRFEKSGVICLNLKTHISRRKDGLKFSIFPKNEPLKMEASYLENEIRLVSVDHPSEHGCMCQFIAAGQHSSNHSIASRCLKRANFTNFKISYAINLWKKYRLHYPVHRFDGFWRSSLQNSYILTGGCFS